MPIVPGLKVRTSDAGPSMNDFDTPYGEYIDAVGHDIKQFSTPFAQSRLTELNNAELGEPENDYYNPRAFAQSGDPRFIRRLAPATPMVDRTTALERAKQAGVTLDIPETGIRGGALDILIDRNVKSRQAAEARAGAPSSFAAIGVPLEILAGIADPLNVASSFIPVVGEARWASMLARTAGRPLARAGGRAALGAVDAAVGAAVIEPLTMAYQSTEQADYGLMDSVLNVTFGTVLGGGLHSVAGAVGDVVARNEARAAAADLAATITPEARATVLRAAISQVAEGRPVEVDALVRAQLPEQAAPDLTAREELMAQAENFPGRQELRDATNELAALDRQVRDTPSFETFRAALLDNLETQDVELHGRETADTKHFRRLREKAADKQARAEYEPMVQALADRHTRMRAEVERMTAGEEALTKLRAVERQERAGTVPRATTADVHAAATANDSAVIHDDAPVSAAVEKQVAEAPKMDTRDDSLAAAKAALADETALLREKATAADSGTDTPVVTEGVRDSLAVLDEADARAEGDAKAAKVAGECLARLG